MSPEQISGDHGAVDRRTDVYSLGVTLFEALTLRLPFQAPTREGLYREILTSGGVDSRQYTRKLSRDLRVVVATAMARRPDHRYRTAADFADDLASVLARGPVRARPQPFVARVWRQARRAPLRAAAVVAVGIAIPSISYVAGRWEAMQPTLAAGRASILRGDYERTLAEGFVLYYDREYVEARQTFARARDAVPRERDALAGIVFCDARLGQLTRAHALLGVEDQDDQTVRRLLTFLSRRTLDARPWEDLSVREDPSDLFVQGSLYLVEGYSAIHGRARQQEFFRRALALLRRAVLLSPIVRLHYYRQLAHAAALIDGEPAVAEFAAALRHLWPDEPTALLAGALALRQHDPSAAIALCNELRERWPDRGDSRVILADALSHQRDYDRARRVLREQIDNGTARFDAYRRLALLDQGRSGAAALRLAQEAAHRFVDRPAAHVLLGAMLSRGGDLAAARQSIETALRILPGHVRAGAEMLALRYFECRTDPSKLDAVEGDVRAFLRGAPHTLVALEILGKIRGQRGDLAEAEACFRKAIAAEEKPGTWVSLASVLEKRGHAVQAEESYERAIELDPDSARAHYCLGTLRQKRRAFAGAEIAYRAAIALRADYAEAYCNLALVLANGGRANEALPLIEKGHALGAARPTWRYESARWARRIAERAVQETEHLGILDRGSSPGSAAQMQRVLSLAMCRHRYLDGVRVLDAAAATPTPFTDRVGSASRGAGTACLLHVGFGLGVRGDAVSGDERSGYRRRGLDRLRHDLATWRRMVTKDPAAWRQRAIRQLQLVLEGDSLAAVRDEKRYAELSAAERAEFVGLWKEIRAAVAGFASR